MVFCREDSPPIDPDQFRRYVLYPAMDAAGIKREKWQNGLHMFRHTVVSEISNLAGLRIAQEQAGHSD